MKILVYAQLPPTLATWLTATLPNALEQLGQGVMIVEISNRF